MSRTFFVRCLFGSILALVATVPKTVHAQITFERTYGGVVDDFGHSVQQTSDGGYIIVGYTSSFGGNPPDVYLVKTDFLGDTVWTRTYGGVRGDYGYSVQQTRDGGYIIAGATFSFGAGWYDVYLIRTDSLGHTLWTRTYGGSDYDRGYSVQQTQDGGYIIAGETRSFSAGDDVYLVRTDSVGDTAWTRTYGGASDDHGYSVQQTKDGGYIIAGATYSFGAGLYDVYLITTDSLGDTLWTRTYGGSEHDLGHSVQQTKDGGYIIGGGTGSFGGDDVYLIRMDSLGETLWTRTCGGIQSDYGYSVQQTLDGGYIAAGLTASHFGDSCDVYLVKTDSVGDTLWTRTYGGTLWDWGRSVLGTEDGGYAIAGFTESFGAGGYDFYLIKTDENGFVGITEDQENRRSKIEDRRLLQNQPNPFQKSTIISYSLPSATEVTLEVYDITGRLVETVVNEKQQSGIHQVRWNRKSNPSGVYFYRLKAGEFVETRKMVVVE